MQKYLTRRPKEGVQQGKQDVPARQTPQSQHSGPTDYREFPQQSAAYDGGKALEETMRARMERQFGLPMDDVRVHRNSPKPAQFEAGAYTYGSQIYLGPGEEALLPHELTHVVQQKLGQVHPTGREHGLAINHDPVLEHCADTGTVVPTVGSSIGPVVQCGITCSACLDEEDKKEPKEPKTKEEVFQWAMIENVKDRSGHGQCHGYTSAYLRNLSDYLKRRRNVTQSQGSGEEEGEFQDEDLLNDIGKFILEKIDEGVSLNDIYDSLHQEGISKPFVRTADMKNMIGQIVFFVDPPPGKYVQHSMAIYDSETFIGVNNSKTLGKSDDILPNVMAVEGGEGIEIEKFGGISKETYEKNPSVRWNGDQFQTAVGSQQKVELLPTRGNLEKEVIEKLGTLRETLKPRSPL